MSGGHFEQIICPKCKAEQQATVEHTEPWWSYVHHCEKCKYTITDSEWEKKEPEPPAITKE